MMRLAFASIVGCLLVSTNVASSQDKATPLPQAGYPGEWTSVTKKGAFFSRLIVSHKDDDWWIAAWVDPDQEASWGKVRLSLLGANVGDKALPYGFATWDNKISTTHLIVRLDNGELVAELFDLAKTKGGSNLHLQQKFKKK
jgi:hypothetical protein